MGSNVELSNLYLKLFKLVFGSVSLFAAENEQMLKVKVICVKNKSALKTTLLRVLHSLTFESHLMFEAPFVTHLPFFPNLKYIILFIRDDFCEYFLHIWNYEVMY